ncbi:hypothetical protein BX666DRAFT_1989585 [Dichotomocladium elegans]|nr:hypothetical protein BX666DRAFT_1989585 [Dichotomocladium elegans]
MRPSFPHAQQCSIYEGRKINAAYSNDLNMQFGQRLRRAVNTLLDIRCQKAIMERGLFDQSLSTEEIRARILENVIEPVRRFKSAISSRQINTDLIRQQPDVFGEALQALLAILGSYLKATDCKKTASTTTASPAPPTTWKSFTGSRACSNVSNFLPLIISHFIADEPRVIPLSTAKYFAKTFFNDLGTMMTNSSTWTIGMR